MEETEVPFVTMFIVLDGLVASEIHERLRELFKESFFSLLKWTMRFIRVPTCVEVRHRSKPPNSTTILVFI